MISAGIVPTKYLSLRERGLERKSVSVDMVSFLTKKIILFFEVHNNIDFETNEIFLSIVLSGTTYSKRESSRAFTLTSLSSFE